MLLRIEMKSAEGVLGVASTSPYQTFS